MTPLPPSSRTVLRVLDKEGAMTHKDIVKKTHCNPRTVRYAIKKLKENKLIIEKMNIRDMRQIIYQFRIIPPLEAGRAENGPGSCEV
jgi:transcription initiation factor IIE alpha subunit